MNNREKLTDLLSTHETLRLHTVGRVNMGTYLEPDMRDGVMFITRERLDERGRLWVFVPLSEELLDENPEAIAKVTLAMAEDQLEILRAA